jgi:hypothetical protein
MSLDSQDSTDVLVTEFPHHHANTSVLPGLWPAQKAWDWHASRSWRVGCNFTPSSAINQLEMWQADSFDHETIERELGWARTLGFTSIRVFLHNLLWDCKELPDRMERFLEVTHGHGINVMFVLLDACWDPLPRPGKQRMPRPHTHNSGWLQAPGAEILAAPERHDELEDYVSGVITRFANDERVECWDLFNEPDNRSAAPYDVHEPAEKTAFSLMLLRKAFGWARRVAPSQPLTSGVWRGTWIDPEQLTELERFQLENSDVISFHNYGPLTLLQECHESLRRYSRPILCTEFMARPSGSTFSAKLSYMKDHGIGAYSWGFVTGKTQTQYPWDSWSKPYESEPAVWFHDILRSDGSPFDPSEVELIRLLSIHEESRKCR